MRAMVMTRERTALVQHERERPEPTPDQILVEVAACGVCRSDLHVLDGELPDPTLPLVLGHEIVGRVVECGSAVAGFAAGQRVGIPWLGWSCGECRYCRCERENLCPRARYTGYTIDGGYAEYAVADQRYVFPVGEELSAAEAAPLLCAGLIGYRSYRFAVEGPHEVRALGLWGFGAAAHILVQLATADGRDVYAFTRPGDEVGQRFARELGAIWAGGSDEPAPVPLDASILFAPLGALVPAALRASAPGTAVVAAGIHMSDVPSFPYRILWGERSVRSVANLTRRDAREFLALAPRVPVRTHVTRYPLERANQALADLREGRLSGAAVLEPG